MVAEMRDLDADAQARLEEVEPFVDLILCTVYGDRDCHWRNAVLFLALCSSLVEYPGAPAAPAQSFGK